MAETEKFELNKDGYLPQKRFKIDLKEFEDKFVYVDDTSKREMLYEKYKSFCKRFEHIIIKVWVNGSYTTGKKLPGDIDMAVHFDALKFENLSLMSLAEKQAFTNREGIKKRYMLHSLLVPVYPNNHPAHAITKMQSEKWEKLFFKDTRNNPPVIKGYVELNNYLGVD
jgi:predicted nucleotidyltransferase